MEVQIIHDGRRYIVRNGEIACIGVDRSFDVAMKNFCSEFVGTLYLTRQAGRDKNEFVDRILFLVEGFRWRQRAAR
ncbi:MAG: hypothetical protein IKM91_09690 [Candidatus Methanomethylophilaceae archaeon]|nr:hypothetical protein [Candidatus Methanomethylophilaceae archaeon]MBR6038416.1 hypothetical protein [Candidatus Methanomethylophilaceae archaeon]MBR6871862.1 hypothetical protein [Candidatus Methanomethylophilaceae archaeon]